MIQELIIPGHHSDSTQVTLCPLLVCVDVGGLCGVGLLQARAGQKPGELVISTLQVKAGWVGCGELGQRPFARGLSQAL